MSDRFRLLAAPNGTASRQSTLRNALDWSWDLLGGDERAALAQLSVFEGGFSLEAAEAVLVLEALWAVDAVQSLVDKSLVCALDDERFRLLVSVQAYAAEKLEASGARAETEARHGAHFAAHGADASLDRLHGHEGLRLRRALARDFDNLTAASRRAVARGDADVAVRTALAAFAVVEDHGPMSLGVALLDAARPLVALGSALEGRLLVRLGRGLALIGRGHEGRGPCDEALGIFRATGDRRGLAGALLDAVWIASFLGEAAPARAFCEEALVVCSEVDDARTEALTLLPLGWIRFQRGAYREARPLVDRGLTRARHARTEAKALGIVACLDHAAGEHERSRRWYEAAIAIARQQGDAVLEAKGEQVLSRQPSQLLEQDRAAPIVDRARDLGDQQLHP